MKIIQLIQKPQRRGAEIFAAQLSEKLMLSGHEVVMVSVFEGDSKLLFSGEWIQLHRPISKRFYDVKGWRAFAQLVKEFNPDIVQANAADTLKFSVLSKKFFGWKIPIVYRNANQMGDFIKNSLHRRFNQFLINHISAVVSVSQASTNDFHKTFAFPYTNSICIPIGIDTHAIQITKVQSTDISLPSNFILQIGGLVEEKDPMGMLKIFSEISDEYVNLHLVYLGSGALRNTLVQQLAAQDLKSVVHIIDAQANIFPILSQAKALVMPSKIEGLPGVILEAMYCKVPVVAYNVGGISEVLKNNETGWLVPHGDTQAFSEAIKEVLQLRDTEKSQITDQAFQLVNDIFAIEKIAKQFEGFYSSVIARIETKNDFA